MAAVSSPERRESFSVRARFFGHVLVMTQQIVGITTDSQARRPVRRNNEGTRVSIIDPLAMTCGFLPRPSG